MVPSYFRLSFSSLPAAVSGSRQSSAAASFFMVPPCVARDADIQGARSVPRPRCRVRTVIALDALRAHGHKLAQDGTLLTLQSLGFAAPVGRLAWSARRPAGRTHLASAHRRRCRSVSILDRPAFCIEYLGEFPRR